MRPLKKSAALAATLALVLALIPALPASAVDLPAPPPIGGVQLNDVQFIDANTGWAVGGFMSGGKDYAVVLRTVDGGASWTRRTVLGQPDAHYFKRISMISASVGFAVDGATADRVYKTSDGGMTWSSLVVPTVSGEAGNVFESVHFVSASTGFVSGSQVGGDKMGVVWKTTNGGDSWTRVGALGKYVYNEEEPVQTNALHSVSAISGSSALAVGRENFQGDALVYTYNGSGWATQTVPAAVAYSRFSSASYLSSTSALAVGPLGRVIALAGSSTWTNPASGVTADLEDVQLVDATHGWAVGASGVIRFWNGSAFSGQTSGATQRLRGVHFRDASSGWAVGDGETILKTANGGQTWSRVTIELATNVKVEKIEGAGRYDTAVAASQKAFPSATGGTVLIAYGRNFPDALGGAALAGAYDAPLLLTETNTLPDPIATEIQRLQATQAVIIGSESVVSKAVADEIKALLGGSKTIVRVAGAGRYETAAQVATTTPVVDTGGTTRTDVFLAVGDNFPDALAASPAAFKKKWPILLTRRDALPAATTAALSTLQPQRVHILGSTGAVPAVVENELKAKFPGVVVDRWQGGTRYATAVDIAEKSDLSVNDFDGLAIATGQNFPDALAGGVMQGKLGKVVLLTTTTSLAPDTSNALAAHRDGISTVRYLGSTSAVAQSVRDAVIQVLQ